MPAAHTFLFLNGISGGEVILVFLFILIFFGADKIPQFARTFGRTMRQMRDATSSIQKDFESSASEVRKDFKEIKDNVSRQGSQVGKDFSQFKDDVEKEGDELNKNTRL